MAVVADKFWPAKQARDLLKIDWSLEGRGRMQRDLRVKYRELARRGNVAVTRGDEKALDQVAAANRIVAEFEFPYLAHAPMEPLKPPFDLTAIKS